MKGLKCRSLIDFVLGISFPGSCSPWNEADIYVPFKSLCFLLAILGVVDGNLLGVVDGNLLGVVDGNLLQAHSGFIGRKPHSYNDNFWNFLYMVCVYFRTLCTMQYLIQVYCPC